MLDPLDASLARDGNAIVVDYVEAARMTTLSDIARRNRDGRASLRKNLRRVLDSVEAHARALSRFGIEPGSVSVACGDARDLRAAGIDDPTVDRQMNPFQRMFCRVVRRRNEPVSA